MLITIEEIFSLIQNLQEELEGLCEKQKMLKEAGSMLDSEIRDVEASINNLQHEFVTRKHK